MDDNTRCRVMEFNWKMYRGLGAMPERSGGQREAINSLLGNRGCADLALLLNPVERIVEFYQNVLRGRFGSDIKLTGPSDFAYKILKDSRFDIRKAEWIRYGACFGVPALRVVSDAQRTVIRPVDPRHLREVVLDADDVVQHAVLEYVVNGDRHREVFTPKWTEVDGKRVSNTLGKVPLIIGQHIRNPDDWAGLPAFHSSMELVLQLSATMSHITSMIAKHYKPVWVIIAAGERPDRIQIDDQTALVLDPGPNDSVPPSIESMTPKLPLQDAIATARDLRQEMRSRQPELTFMDVGDEVFGRSGTSGEMISQYRQPAVERLKHAGVIYETMLSEALSVALAWEQQWGRGPGDVTVGFEPRPALPETQGELLKMAQGEAVAIGSRAKAASFFLGWPKVAAGILNGQTGDFDPPEAPVPQEQS